MTQGIEAVAALMAQASLDATPASTQMATPQPPDAAGSFAGMVRNAVLDMNSNVAAAEGTLSNLAAGKGVEPQEAMISLERARISVLTFVQLRNRLVESYQDLMRMQL